MKKIFLESHNIKNLYFGFGQFNYSLIKALDKLIKNEEQIQLVINVDSKKRFVDKFSNLIKYKKYRSIQRYPMFRIRKKYDLWHSLNQNTKIEPLLELPYVLTVHDVNFIEERSKKTQEERNLRFQNKLDRSDSIVYISEFVKKMTYEYFNVPNVPQYVIYNGNPIENVSLPSDYKSNLSLSGKFIFSIGEFTFRKNMKSLVHMISKSNDLQLVLAGKDTTQYGKELKELVFDLGLTKRVHILGRISEYDKIYCYKNCSAFAFPSLREGFGMPVVEAMSYGRPLFLSNNTSLPEIGGEFSFYWDNYDADYMLDIFLRGMNLFDKNEETYSKWYINRAKSFNWGTAALEYLKVYKNVLGIS